MKKSRKVKKLPKRVTKRSKKSKRVNEKGEGFQHYDIEWQTHDTPRGTHFSTNIDNIQFYGQILYMENIKEWTVSMWYKRLGDGGLAVKISYKKDPRINLPSLDADLCAAISKWMHDHPYPGSTCQICGSPSHQANAPVDACVKFLLARLDRTEIEINRMDTLDELITTLKDFRTTCIKCGGTRSFFISGDNAGGPRAQLKVDLTSYSRVLDGRVPSVGSGRALTLALESNDSNEKVKEPKQIKGKQSNIDDLVSQLHGSKDSVEKRKLRALLRKLGHRGGARQQEEGVKNNAKTKSKRQRRRSRT